MEASDRVSGSEGRPRRDLRETLVVASLLVACYVASHAALLSRFPWFVDETYFATFAQTVQGDPAQRFIALSDHKGLLVTWIAALMIKLHASPMVAMRLISVISGLVSAGATGYLVWRWQASLRLALVAAALVAFVPYMFVHDSVGIYDPFVAAGSMVALALELELARRQRLDLALLLGMTLGGLLLAKPTGELAIVLIPASLVVFDWDRRALVRRLLAWGALIGLALAITLAMYALTRLSPLAYTPDLQNHRTVGDLFSDPFGNWGTIAPKAADALWGYMTPPGVLLACWGLVRVAMTRDRLGIVAAVWALGALVAFFLLTDTAYPRYGLQSVAPLCILIVIGGLDLWQRGRQLVSWRWLALVAAILAIPMLLLDARVLVSPQTAPYPGLDRDQYVTLVSNREPAREAAETILKRAPRAFTPSTPPAQRTVADLDGWAWATLLVLDGDRYTPTPRFIYADQTSDHAFVNHARFVIVEGAAPSWLDVARATLVRRWTRAGGGPPVELYDRGS